MRQDYLVLKRLVKVFGTGEAAFTAVDNVNIDVQEGELVTLLGPSGCGKTTTLRMISGFELPTSGEIRIDGEDVSTTPPNQRPTTMVFQNYALFPHLTVFENIAYGLRCQRATKDEIKRKVASGKAFGTGARLVTPAEIKEKFPLIEEDMVQGGMWDPNAGLVVPRSQTVSGILVDTRNSNG